MAKAACRLSLFAAAGQFFFFAFCSCCFFFVPLCHRENDFLLREGNEPRRTLAEDAAVGGGNNG